MSLYGTEGVFGLTSEDTQFGSTGDHVTDLRNAYEVAGYQLNNYGTETAATLPAPEHAATAAAAFFEELNATLAAQGVGSPASMAVRYF